MFRLCYGLVVFGFYGWVVIGVVFWFFFFGCHDVEAAAKSRKQTLFSRAVTIRGLFPDSRQLCMGI